MKQNPHLPGTPEEFIKNNMGLAHFEAWRFYKFTRSDPTLKFEQEDFYSIAYLGLIQAYLKFDGSKDIKFSTYAVTVIQNILKNAIRDYGHTIRRNREGKALYVDSLDRAIDEEGNTLLDAAHPETIDNYDQIILSDFYSKLQPHYQRYYDLRTKGLSQQRIAKLFNVSQAAISRIDVKLIEFAKQYGLGERVGKSDLGRFLEMEAI